MRVPASEKLRAPGRQASAGIRVSKGGSAKRTAADLFQQQQKVDGHAWKSKPSWFIVAKNDRTVHPDLQRFLAKRMGATTTETNSSHVIMLSQPDVVIDVIRKAAAAVAAKGKAA
jgi:pimeloyl-ACP methyl ester carboxylesterase